jgi:cytosine/adenosine deaminase-related metal-dependent hydrolase
MLFRNAIVLEVDAAGCASGAADVRVAGATIAAVGAGIVAEPGEEVIDASGLLLMPGLVNAHFHSPVNHLKGSLPCLPLEVFMLFESPVLEGPGPSPRAVYVRTMLAALEMLKGGVTAVQDDAFLMPHPTPEIIDAVMQAYADCGIRATVALDQPNVPEIEKLPFLTDLTPPDLRARLSASAPMDAAGLLDCCRHLIETWHGSHGGRLRAAVSCSAPQRVTPDYFAALDELSRSRDLPLYVHVLETKLQRVFGEERLGGRSLIRYVADLGLLSERLNIIHGIWLDEADLDLVAESGALVAHNPISNLRLGSGVMPFRGLREHGIPICLGSDEAIADDAVNMWLVAKLAGLIHNITEPDYQRWPKAHEVLDCLIGGGARAMRQSATVGRIAPGYQADLIMIDLDTLPFTPLNDLKRQLVYCESGGSVRLTMVAGRIVVERGVVTTVDEAALRAEAREQAAAYAGAKGAIDDAARDLQPFYRAMYLKAAAADVGFSRWAGDTATR